VKQLSLVVLQVDVSNRWIWKLHSSHRYMVKSAYNYLTSSDVAIDDRCNHVLWLKQISLKVNIFIWRLFMNRLATKMNLFRRNILDYNDSFCSTSCEFLEDQDHLFLSCAFFLVNFDF
jgi:hypothetical protein